MTPCPKCGQPKAPNRGYCRECWNAYYRAYWQAHPELAERRRNRRRRFHKEIENTLGRNP